MSGKRAPKTFSMSAVTRPAAAVALFRELPRSIQPVLLRIMWLMIRRSKREATHLRPFRKYAPDVLAGVPRGRARAIGGVRR